MGMAKELDSPYIMRYHLFLMYEIIFLGRYRERFEDNNSTVVVMQYMENGINNKFLSF
jgi:hypothetical protein